MRANDIAEQLHARRNSGGWIARCPAHEDRDPSLSISERNGRILLHCFVGCTAEAICDCLKIKISDLFSTSGAIQSKPHVVREAEKHVSDLRNRLTRRERDVMPVTIIYCDSENVDEGIARALALTVEGELVQVHLEGPQ
jgi:hypothetical protein